MTAMQTLREALGIVRSTPPAEIAALEEQDRAAADEAARAAKLAGDKAAKVEKALPARIEAIVADYLALQSEAIREAASDLARAQLEAELGVTSPKALTFGGYPPSRLAPGRVERVLGRLVDSAAVPWDRAGRAASVIRSEGTRAVSEAFAASTASPVELTNEELVERRRAQLEAQRAAAITARKRDMKLPGWREGDGAA